MARCKSCGKSGLLTRLDKQIGLCLSCKAAFAEKAKPLTQKLMEVENMNLPERLKGIEIIEKEPSDDPKTIVGYCEAVEECANKLIALEKEYSLEPGPELTQIINKYAQIKQKALNKMK